MDQTIALEISKTYLSRLKKNNFNFSDVWLFGSFARGNQHENSDIDLAIVMNDNNPITFEKEVEFMTCRKGEDTLIEPHIFSKQDFDSSEPLVYQIKKYGLLINI